MSAGVPRKARAEAAAAKEKSKGEAFREKMREMEGQADMMCRYPHPSMLPCWRAGIGVAMVCFTDCMMGIAATYRKTEYTTIKFSNSEPLRLAIFMKKGQGFKWDPGASLFSLTLVTSLFSSRSC